MSRDHRLYHGQQTSAFTVLSQFQTTPLSVKFAFDSWPGIASFDAGDNATGRSRIDFSLTPEEIAAHHDVLDAVRLAVLAIAGVDNWTVDNFMIQTSSKVIVISVTPPTGDQRRDFLYDGDAYDALLADPANQQLVGEVLTLAWTYGKTKDAYLAALTAV